MCGCTVDLVGFLCYVDCFIVCWVSVCLLLLTYSFDLRLLLAACALCSVAVCGLLVCWSVGLVVLFAGCFAVLICFYWLVVWLAVLWLFLAITFAIGFAAELGVGLVCGFVG